MGRRGDEADERRKMSSRVEGKSWKSRRREEEEGGSRERGRAVDDDDDDDE